MERYGGFKIFKALFWIAVYLFSMLFVFGLYIIKPFRKFKLFMLLDDKIGHLGPYTNMFLQRIKNNTIKIEKGVHYIGIANSMQSNAQLSLMFRRELLKAFKGQLKLVQISQSDLKQAFIRAVFFKSSLFSRSEFCQEFPIKTHYVQELSTCKPPLSFTPEEEERGKKLLRKMRIPKKAWFVCLHSRDSAYLKKTSDIKQAQYFDYRDCDINNYLKSGKYIASKGGFAIRMGSIVEKKLPKLLKIIDYSTKYRTDFGDIYLSAKCKFFLDCTSGLGTIPSVFNRPVANANVIPIVYPPYRKGDLFIPKKLLNKKEKRFLTFKEMIEFEKGKYLYTRDFEKAGLVPIENTPDEILDLAKEMNGRLDGKFKYTKEDEKLQRKFQSLFKSKNAPYRHHIRIGAKFLRENKDLLQ